jgi:hypothetical protein
MTAFLLGLILGGAVKSALDSFLERECCRQHRETHATCPCQDCADIRRLGAIYEVEP